MCLQAWFDLLRSLFGIAACEHVIIFVKVQPIISHYMLREGEQNNKKQKKKKREHQSVNLLTLVVRKYLPIMWIISLVNSPLSCNA